MQIYDFSQRLLGIAIMEIMITVLVLSGISSLQLKELQFSRFSEKMRDFKMTI